MVMGLHLSLGEDLRANYVTHPPNRRTSGPLCPVGKIWLYPVFIRD